MSLDNDRMIIENNQYIPNNYDKENMKSNLYIGDCIRELTNELKNINKNLEKIANKDFLQVGDLKTTVNNVGSFIPNKEVNVKDIVYKLNKDSYVDKNIISD